MGIKCLRMWFEFQAASLALHYFPVLNAMVDDKMENVIYKVNI